MTKSKEVSTETLKDFIKGQGYGVAPSAVVAICEDLLAVREAQSVPIGVLDIQRNREDQPFLMIENAAARELPDDTYQLFAAPPVAVMPAPITFSENTDADMCREWAWEQVKKDVTTGSWTIGDSSNFYGFYCWGWDMRRQYNEQRAPAVPDDVAAALDWIDDFIARCNGDDKGACNSVNVLRRAVFKK